MDTLRVGHGRECITPPLGIKMVGYARRTEGAADVHDDLFVNSVVLENGGERVAILTYDVCLLRNAHAAEFKAAIQEQTGLEPDQVLLNTSHTHAGPSLGGPEADPMENDYRRDVVRKSLKALQAALADVAPAPLSVGSAHLDIGGNRRERQPDGSIWLGRNPDGPTLQEVTVWRFARADRPDVVLFSAPVHGVVLGQWNLTVTGEWMGRTVQRLEVEMRDTRFVFLQGCCGDQNAYATTRDNRRGTFGELEQAARTACAAVQKALEDMKELAGAPLRSVIRTEQLPPKDEDGEPQQLNLHGIRLGDAMVVALGCEPFVEYALFGRDISPAKATLVLGYSDGGIGYLPTADAYPEGGYEVSSARVAPESEQIAKEAIRDIFGELGQ